MRGRKGTVYQGGIRVPFLMRWTGRLKPGKKVDRIAAHIDILPTLLEASGVGKPSDLSLDGRSLLPQLKGDSPQWPDRTLYFQWHRGDEPELFRACAARSQRYKLVNGKELYDLIADPAERNDIAAQQSDIVNRMREDYEKWFRDVSATRGYDPPRIHLGTRFENPVTLTRQDWRGPRAGWGANSVGYWEVKIARSARFNVRLRFRAFRQSAKAHFRLHDVTLSKPLKDGATSFVFDSVALKAGDARLEAWIETGGKTIGVSYVDVERLD